MAAPINRVRQYFGSVLPKNVPSFQQQASAYLNNSTTNQVDEVQQIVYLATLYNVAGLPPLFYYGMSPKEMTFILGLLQKDITPIRNAITFKLDWPSKPQINASNVQSYIDDLSPPKTTA